LLLNGLRDRIVVQVDGQLKTGRDVVMAALLGAEEFGFATAPLVVAGCIMMRVCHLDTCPVGVATQNPVLRQRFNAQPEFVENFFMFIAEEVRELMAQLGFRTVNEMVGQVGTLDTAAAAQYWKAHKLDLTPVLYEPESAFMNQDLYCSSRQDHGLDKALDQQLIAQSREAIDSGSPVRFSTTITNVNRTVGTMLGHEVTKAYGGQGLPDGTIDITFEGSAGNSFGAFLPSGITLRVYGDANDYVGKGLSGGQVVIRPPDDAPVDYVAEDNIIAGNVILFGATSGRMFLRGQVGERFAVRNSGAHAVVEGVGDHGCEYMTGGRVVILGPTGRNFAAGMSGGIGFVYDPDDVLADNLNAGMVDIEALDGHSEDARWLRGMIQAHVDATDSEVGQRILTRWDSSESEMRHFKKVMPRDYKRVLEAIAKAERRGADESETAEAIMAAASG
jgi:glutamate synthase (NADPH) large chain